MSSAVASYASGSANAAATQNVGKQNVYSQQLGLYAQGPRKEVLPYLDDSLGRLTDAYTNRGAFINPMAVGSQGYNQAIAMGMQAPAGQDTVNRAASGYESYLNSGRNMVTPDQVSAGANSLLNTSLIDSQVDAYGRDIGRSLGENVITGIRSNDIASGNLGSSRGGVQEAIARRGAEDRIADFRGGLVGNALQQSQGLLQANAAAEGSGYGQLAGMGQTQQAGSAQQLSNLFNVGQLQQGLSQAEIDNQMAARDYNITNEAQYGSLLRDYASVGNLIRDPGIAPKIKDPDSWAEAQFKF